MENLKEESVLHENVKGKSSETHEANMDLEGKHDLYDKKTSATTKALHRVEKTEIDRTPRYIKPGKTSNKLKKQRMNEKLTKLLTPKNALNLLHEVKPGCVYLLEETNGPENLLSTGSFTAQVKCGKDILGSGKGFSKSQAKNLAAEDAIKTLFFKAIKSISERGAQSEDGEVFPWAGLAQFAMHKMINEWQLRDPDFPQNEIQKFLNSAKTPKVSSTCSQSKRDVPPDAHKLHPTAVLNNLHPNLTCVELERTIGPPSRVKMAFMLEGKQYCGVSSNKKEARKEAAKVLLTTVYGVQYESKCEQTQEETVTKSVEEMNPASNL